MARIKILAIFFIAFCRCCHCETEGRGNPAVFVVLSLPLSLSLLLPFPPSLRDRRSWQSTAVAVVVFNFP
jgi:hypothetical protein